MTYLDKLSDVSRTQVLAKGLNLKELFKDEFLNELKDKLDNYEDIIIADIKIMLIPKEKKVPIKEGEKGIIIQLADTDFIKFEHPSPEHYKDKIIVISSNRKDNLDKLLK